MLLIIDNTEDDQITFSIWLDKKFIQKVFTIQHNQDLLLYVDELLAGLQLSVQDIRCLGVVMGVGKFTGTRLAVTLANTLAYALQIPVISLAKDFDPEKALSAAGSAVAGTYITPVYSAAPHLYGDPLK